MKLEAGQKVWVLFDMIPQEVVFLEYEYNDKFYFETGGRLASHSSRRLKVRYPDGSIKNVKYAYLSLNDMLTYLKCNAIYQKEEAA